jgi:hypothetical protein
MKLMRQSSNARTLLSLMIAVAVVLSNIATLSAHMPNQLAKAEDERHLQFQIEIAEHGHSHDDGFEDDHHHGHHHGHHQGHDAADHSHDVPNMLSDAVTVTRAAVRDWLAGPPATYSPDEAFRLKRPPRVS